jgi:hypothetical protein
MRSIQAQGAELHAMLRSTQEEERARRDVFTQNAGT